MEDLSREELIEQLKSLQIELDKKNMRVTKEKQKEYRLIRLKTNTPVPSPFAIMWDFSHVEEEKTDRRFVIDDSWNEENRHLYLGTLETWMGKVTNQSYIQRVFNVGSVKIMTKAWIEAMQNPVNHNYHISNGGKHIWRVVPWSERKKQCDGQPWKDIHLWEMCDSDSNQFFWQLRQNIWDFYIEWLDCKARGRGVYHLLMSHQQHCFWPRTLIVKLYEQYISELVRPTKKLSKKVVMP